MSVVVVTAPSRKHSRPRRGETDPDADRHGHVPAPLPGGRPRRRRRLGPSPPDRRRLAERARRPSARGDDVAALAVAARVVEVAAEVEEVVRLLARPPRARRGAGRRRRGRRSRRRRRSAPGRASVAGGEARPAVGALVAFGDHDTGHLAGGRVGVVRQLEGLVGLRASRIRCDSVGSPGRELVVGAHDRHGAERRRVLAVDRAGEPQHGTAVVGEWLGTIAEAEVALVAAPAGVAARDGLGRLLGADDAHAIGRWALRLVVDRAVLPVVGGEVSSEPVVHVWHSSSGRASALHQLDGLARRAPRRSRPRNRFVTLSSSVLGPS